jgi:hypothetical protein
MPACHSSPIPRCVNGAIDHGGLKHVTSIMVLRIVIDAIRRGKLQAHRPRVRGRSGGVKRR